MRGDHKLALLNGTGHIASNMLLGKIGKVSSYIFKLWRAGFNDLSIYTPMEIKS